ncbi:Acetyltransferase (GNAT) family protein [Posidoniimonas polymericola]|uniref:Acetyltransferase (GNAT) family protein n=1 Tax=Posidoniimonas polymericola TaxID=2528002 RepID=A0A5C5YLF7_9BACT|nr:GNAT family N-acetyltransferase [Posidoniimonas polymericola]TWT75639.1 Acetyltransferase (GNAT) family protein [Posidoniimonas polymericola]
MHVNFDLARSGFSIESCDASDRAIRMLLPPLGRGATCLAAVEGEHGLVVGAAGLTAEFRGQDPVGPGVAIHVISPCRRRGVGSALLVALEGLAQSRGGRALYASQRVDADSGDAEDWRRLGFSPCARVETHSLPLQQFEPRLGPLLERMVSRGRVPEDARIVPLHVADADQVVGLHVRCLGGESEVLAARVRGEAPDAFHPRYSRVLLLGGRVVGCILAHRVSRDVAAVDANCVAEEVRGGWANIWLKLEATRGAQSLGVKRFEFTTFDQYADTRSFTARMGGVTTRTMLLMRKMIQG